MQLSEEQQAVVAYEGGHARIIAVAGAGKTTTLCHYLHHRLEKGLDPRRCLVLMYNRSARVDFERRLRQLNTEGRALPEVRTFHSLGLKILHAMIQRGWRAPVKSSLLSQVQAEWQLLRLLKARVDDTTRQILHDDASLWMEPLTAFVEQVKSGLRSPTQVFSESKLPHSQSVFVEVFEDFELWRQQQGLITFADMIYDPCRLLMDNPEIRQVFSAHMDEILVDEFQDINEIQHFLLMTLYGGRGRVLAIGDPDQTIYEFRGSRPEFLLNTFVEDLPDVQTLSLSGSFRCPAAITLPAACLIAHNQGRLPVIMQAISDHQGSCELHETDDEAAYVLSLIQRSLGSGVAGEQIAVLCRLWSSAVSIELQLLLHGIDYQTNNQQSIFSRYELRPIMGLFELAAGNYALLPPSGQETYLRSWLSQPYLPIKRDKIDAMVRWCIRQDEGRPLSSIKDYDWELTSFQERELDARLRIVESARSGLGKAAQLIECWVRSTDYFECLQEQALSQEQAEQQQATVQALLTFCRQQKWRAAEVWPKISSLLEARNKEGGVHLSSIHQAKGREWPVIIVPGLRQGAFPYKDAIDKGSLESERRLAYVAMTRAKQTLHLVVPKNPLARSQFVAEMHLLQTKLGNTEPTSAKEIPPAVQAVLEVYGESVD